MTTSASGSVIDSSGAGLKGLTAVLENASSLRDHEILNTAAVDGTSGQFSFSYASDFGDGSGPGKQFRQLRLRIMLGQLVLKEVVQPDVASHDHLSFDPIVLPSAEADSHWATLGTGTASRVTEGNAIRWLADNVDGWGRVAGIITNATTLDVMQLDIQTNPFKTVETSETPNIVLRFDPSSVYTVPPRGITLVDDRIERRLLEASKRGCVVRIQIPHWQSDKRALMLIGVALVIVLGAILAPWFLLIAAAVTGVVAGGILVADHFLAKSFKAPELANWFTAAGDDARNVKVRELKLRSLFVTHAKMVIDRDKEAVVLGSPFNQDYFDSLQHLIDDPRRGADPAKGPIHDVSVGVRGPALAHLQELYDNHWNQADPSDPLAPPQTLPAVAAVLDAGEVITKAQVVRTLDAQFAAATDGEKGVLEAYLRGIFFARRFIYIENQYFNNDLMTQALIDALNAQPKLCVILLVNVSPDMPLYPGWQQAAIRRIVATDKTRVGVFTKWSHASADATHPKPRLIDNYLHTKSALIDNTWATVGSANLDGASLDFVQYARAMLDGELRNTESNVVVIEETPASPSPVDALRRRLWSEHLGLAGATDPALDDAPTKNWLDLWNQRAGEKLAGLVASPNTVHPAQILPWPSTGYRRDCGKHVASASYLSTLFNDNHMSAMVTNFDLMPGGPPAYPFKY